MVGPLRIGLLSRDVEEKVGRESEELLAEEHVQSVDGSVTEELVPVDLIVGLVRNVQVLAGLGNVHLVTLHGSVVGVVAMVGDPPGKVRSPQEGVSDEAEDVIDNFVVREGTVTALMSDNPDTGEDETLEPPVNTPCSPAGDFRANWSKKLLSISSLEVGIDEGAERPDHSREQNVAGKVEQSAASITNEELGRNCGANFFQRPWHRSVSWKVIFRIFLDFSAGAHVILNRE